MLTKLTQRMTKPLIQRSMFQPEQTLWFTLSPDGLHSRFSIKDHAIQHKKNLILLDIKFYSSYLSRFVLSIP